MNVQAPLRGRITDHVQTLPGLHRADAQTKLVNGVAEQPTRQSVRVIPAVMAIATALLLMAEKSRQHKGGQKRCHLRTPWSLRSKMARLAQCQSHSHGATCGGKDSASDKCGSKTCDAKDSASDKCGGKTCSAKDSASDKCGSKDDHAEHGHGHSHMTIGCSGCAHGEIPKWLPARSFFKRLTGVFQRPVSMGISAALFFASFLTPWPVLRVAGPAAVYTVCGLPLALESLGALELDMHILMLVAAFASIFIGHASEGALLLLLFAVSHEVEERISMQATASLDALTRLSPEVARRVPVEQGSLGASDGEEVRVATLQGGDRILVRAGEVVPVDGQVLDGTSCLGMDHLTGEPLPQSIKPGGVAMSGAKNVDGPLLLSVLRPASESTIQRIIRLTSSAKGTRPKLVTFLDAIGKKWSAFVVVSTAIIATLPPVALGWSASTSLYRAVGWLITASPCALLISTPLVYVSTISMAASNGILLKGGRVLDALSLANGVAFDKTGTITTGAPELQKVVPIGASGETEQSAQELAGLHLASTLGQLSVHPVSRALAMSAPKQTALPTVKSFQLVAGSGVHGDVATPHGELLEVRFGKPSFVAELLAKHDNNLSLMLHESCESTSGDSSADGTVVAALGAVPKEQHAAVPLGAEPLQALEQAKKSLQEGRSDHIAKAWCFLLGDRIKESAKMALPKLDRRLPLYMLTGDRIENAQRVAKELQSDATFTEVRAGLSPEEKLQRVQQYDSELQHKAASANGWKARVLQKLGVSSGGLVMVGDGVNDAPAMAAARVGISLASQADGALPTNAIESSDVLVLRRAGDPSGDSDLERVEWILSTAKEARRLVIQNVCIAILSIIGASFYTVMAGLPLWIGVLLHEGATVLVALNSLRIFKHRSKRS